MQYVFNDYNIPAIHKILTMTIPFWEKRYKALEISLTLKHIQSVYTE